MNNYKLVDWFLLILWIVINVILFIDLAPPIECCTNNENIEMSYADLVVILLTVLLVFIGIASIIGVVFAFYTLRKIEQKMLKVAETAAYETASKVAIDRITNIYESRNEPHEWGNPNEEYGDE